MSKYVFILGAGASRLAGGPLMSDFLDIAEGFLAKNRLVDEDKYAFERVFQGIERLQPVYAKSDFDLENIESLFAAFEMACLVGRLGTMEKKEFMELPNSLRKLIEVTIEKRIEFTKAENANAIEIRAHESYYQFAEMLRLLCTKNTMPDYASASVISFNYDLALDVAMHNHGLKIDYGLKPDEDEDSIKILKLHGSLNWTKCSACQSSDVQVLPIRKLIKSENIRFEKEGNTYRLEVRKDLAKTKHSCGQNCQSVPVIVPPTWNKAYHHKQIEEVWKSAAASLSRAEHIMVIGYSLPESDFFFRYLYALGTLGISRIKNIFVFDPDRSGVVERRFKTLLGPMAKRRFKMFSLRNRIKNGFTARHNRQPIFEAIRQMREIAGIDN